MEEDMELSTVPLEIDEPILIADCSDKHKTNLHLNKESIGNEFISITPSSLKFPHDDPSEHIKRFTIWNKTKQFIGFRIQEPKSKYFKIFYEKNGIYAGTETSIIIKCKPFKQKMYFDSLIIHLTNQDTKPIVLSLEIVPSISWFILPRIITMPNVVIGSSSKYVIKLPEPPIGFESYNFYISGDKPDDIEVIPSEGKIGPGYVDKIKLRYKPTTFTSLTYHLSIHFPQVVVQPFTVTVYMRCDPSFHGHVLSSSGHRSIIEIRRPPTSSDEQQQAHNYGMKIKSQALRHKSKSEEEEEASKTINKADLCTPAGVMKFLLQRGGKIAWSKEFVGPLGITTIEEQKIYKAKEKEFHDKFNRIEIQQKNISIQHSKAIYGDDPIQFHPKLLEQINHKQLQVIYEYQKALGIRDNDIEDLTRHKMKLVRQRIIRDVIDEDNNYLKPQTNSKLSVKASSQALKVKASSQQASKFDDANDIINNINSSKWIHKLALHRFIQAALIIITRKRADKRIIKLKLLVKKIQHERKKKAEELKAAEEKATKDALLHVLLDSSEQTTFLSKLIKNDDEMIPANATDEHYNNSRRKSSETKENGNKRISTNSTTFNNETRRISINSNKSGL